LTCGNVDDGKSTLIGRLLYDSKLIYEDQLQAVTRDSKKVGTTGDAPDLHYLLMVYKLNVSRVLPLM
jgi:sulfate adenylyltransferase subunit 1